MHGLTRRSVRLALVIATASIAVGVCVASLTLPPDNGDTGTITLLLWAASCVFALLAKRSEVGMRRQHKRTILSWSTGNDPVGSGGRSDEVRGQYTGRSSNNRMRGHSADTTSASQRLVGFVARGDCS